MIDILPGLIDKILLSKTVTNYVGVRVYKGYAAQIGEVEYPCVTVERRSPGIYDETAPVDDFEILVTSRAYTTDQAWRVQEAVKSAIGRAQWSVGSIRCTALATTSPFDLPSEEDGKPVYPVAQVFRIRTLGA